MAQRASYGESLSRQKGANANYAVTVDVFTVERYAMP